MMKQPITRTVESSSLKRSCGYGTPYRSFFTGLKEGSEEGGYIVLVTVLILGAVVSVIAGLLLLTGQNASITSNGVVANANAKAAAAGCAQLALGAIAANPSLVTPSTSTQTLNALTGQTCTYTISGTTPNYTINVTGTVSQGPRTYTHRLAVTVGQVQPKVIVSSWQDNP